MADENPRAGVDTSRGCENPLDELTRDRAIQNLLGRQETARRGITDAVRDELDELSHSCQTPEKHEESLRTTLEALLHKKAQEDFAAAVPLRELHFADRVETRASDDFAEFVSREIWDQKALRFRSPEQWARFYKETFRKFFAALEEPQASDKDAKITSVHVKSALEKLDDFDSFYRGNPEAAFATEGILAGPSKETEQKEVAQKDEVTATITMLLDASVGLNAEDKAKVEGLKKKLDDASDADVITPLRKELDAMEEEYRKHFREAMDELIKVLKPALKAPEGAQTAPTAAVSSEATPSPTPSPETPERKEARETVERIEGQSESEKDLVKLAGFKKELEALRTTYVTQKKEVGFWEKTIYNFLLSIGILDIARGFGEKFYRGALDIVAGLANDGAIDDKDALSSYGIVKNQNGLFEVSEVLTTSNDAFLKDRFEISEADFRKKLLKTKLKDFLQNAVDFENYDTAREAYKDQIGVLKKVIKENPAGKDRGQTLDTFLKKSGIRSTLIEELSKLNPQPASDG